MVFLALRYRYRSGDSISHTQCLSCVCRVSCVVSRFSFVCPLYIFANSSFIFHPSLLKFYRHVQNDLAHKRKFSKTCFLVKNNSWKIFFWKNYRFLRTTHSFFIRACSNFTGMCRMTLPKNVNFQKWVLGSKNFLKNYFSEKMTVFCELLIHFSSEPAQILQACVEWPCPKM